MEFKVWLETLAMSNYKARNDIATQENTMKSKIGVEIEIIINQNIDTDGQPIGWLKKELNNTIAHHADDIGNMIRQSGFQYDADDEDEVHDYWTIGEDGLDSVYKMPVMEIRSGILSQYDLPKLRKFLSLLARYVNNNPKFKVAGNTAIHIHVSNPALGSIAKPDAFARLSSIVGVDEKQITQDASQYNRPFDKFAKLTPTQYQEVFDAICLKFHVSVKTPHVVISNYQLAEAMSILSHFSGVNVEGKYNTTEYRHMPTTLLIEPGGVEKVIDYITYFTQHLSSRVNKSQFSIKSTKGTLTFTRQTNNQIRIDLNNVPAQVGRPIQDLKTKSKERTVPIKQWFNTLSPMEKLQLRAKQFKGKQIPGLPYGIFGN